MRIGSLFSGIGGLELGLVAAGLGTVVWQVEIDPVCRSVLEVRWPGVQRFVDVRSVGAAELAPVEVICGGFPCQDLSNARAGGRGLAGRRSGLWFEYLRVVAEMRPRGVIIENVPGLRGRALDTVVTGLYGLGYAVEGTRIRASDLGAPHHRERVVLVAWQAVVGDTDGARRQGPVEDEPAEVRVAAAGGAAQGRPRPAEPPLGRGSDGLSSRVDGGWPAGPDEPQRGWEPPRTVPTRSVPNREPRLRMLGNAVVPDVARIAALRLIELLAVEPTVGRWCPRCGRWLSPTSVCDCPRRWPFEAEAHRRQREQAP